jgi:hypothetical protein
MVVIQDKSSIFLDFAKNCIPSSLICGWCCFVEALSVVGNVFDVRVTKLDLFSNNVVFVILIYLVEDRNIFLVNGRFVEFEKEN